jgi:hypothetical protein
VFGLPTDATTGIVIAAAALATRRRRQRTRLRALEIIQTDAPITFP